jgi:hypothetical protein
MKRNHSEALGVDRNMYGKAHNEQSLSFLIGVALWQDKHICRWRTDDAVIGFFQ